MAYIELHVWTPEILLATTYSENNYTALFRIPNWFSYFEVTGWSSFRGRPRAKL